MTLFGNADVVAQAQGAYFFLTGVWPILSIGTFQMVTGPKRDLWLVKTVGAVITAIGAALFMAGYQSEIVGSIVLLAIGSALALAAVDVIYVAKRVIAPVYLLDAAAEFALVLWWVVSLSAR
ncbi:hypothetical protein LPW11_08465 [Geomonas sp. RF6]|uniref:hypothetical protein n=1 Tax=Geomonas sp. RF6 TaxID=2897342 RepID=UPI001E5BC3A5|nr:hypothetical protein [Geomonas sp. RF6]UFS72213.1 hypothetical protein LPW11_08465 [Geomonas sp. RF6]